MRQSSGLRLRRPIIIHILEEALFEELEVKVSEVSVALLGGPQAMDCKALTKWRRDYWSHCSYLIRSQLDPRFWQ